MTLENGIIFALVAAMLIVMGYLGRVDRRKRNNGSGGDGGGYDTDSGGDCGGSSGD